MGEFPESPGFVQSRSMFVSVSPRMAPVAVAVSSVGSSGVPAPAVAVVSSATPEAGPVPAALIAKTR